MEKIDAQLLGFPERCSLQSLSAKNTISVHMLLEINNRKAKRPVHGTGSANYLRQSAPTGGGRGKPDGNGEEGYHKNN